MDNWSLYPKKGYLLINLSNRIVGECDSKRKYISFHHSLPVTGEELLTTACDIFGYKGTSAMLVKTEYTDISRARNAPVRKSFVFGKEQYEDKSITMFLTPKCPPPHKNRRAIERKAWKAAKKENEASEESEDYDELPEQPEIPFYHPSNKLSKMIDMLAHLDVGL
ncbi:hypothetical protein IW146_006891 [Coemansia sp. RSA 922]|nr:hypothetical protein IW146_006891 [Coemansia sp. RSA 922]